MTYFTGRVIPPRRGGGCLILLVGFTIGSILMLWAIEAEQGIDDLRPRVEACYPITENWCWKYEKFADPGDFEYYKQVYEDSK